ncbi:MAG TPA: class I adenylate-forming enzyme family protein [Planctomycetota bacterium]
MDRGFTGHTRQIEAATPQLTDVLLRAAARLPDKVALVRGDERVTYGELDARSNRLANALARAGVARGDRVLVFLENGTEAVVAFWGALKANAVACLINPLTKPDKLAYLLADSKAAALVSDARLARVVEAAGPAPACLRVALFTGGEPPPGALAWDAALAAERADTRPERKNLDIDLAAIIYTSGSTGDAKGVMLTHRNMIAASTSISAYLELREDEIILGVLPLAFDYGLYQMIMAFQAGARLVLERSFAYPAQVLRKAVDEGVTGFPGVPTIFAILAEMRSRADFDFSRVRYVTNTAAALPTKHIDVLREFFPNARVYSMYGLTECKRCSYLPPEDLERKPTSVGLAIPNTELWVVDDQGRRLGPNEVGQLVVRGATVMKGYWEKPEATAEKLRPGPLPGERVLYTGDYCRFDEEGYLYFVGRMDDIIKSRGEKVPPKEVEGVLLNLPGVKEAAVVGVPDPILGQAVKAFVVLEQTASLTDKQIRHECQSRLEAYMVPREIVFVSDLPKTHTGKIQKTGLVEGEPRRGT